MHSLTDLQQMAAVWKKVADTSPSVSIVRHAEQRYMMYKRLLEEYYG